jgi:hypothetical protein
MTDDPDALRRQIEELQARLADFEARDAGRKSQRIDAQSAGGVRQIQAHNYYEAFDPATEPRRAALHTYGAV